MKRAAAITTLVVLLGLPVAIVFATAFGEGVLGFATTFREPDSRTAILLTIAVAAVVVPVNTVCGALAAWCIARFQFRGKVALQTLIELPLAVSPVISGLVWMLLFGAQGYLGPFLARNGIQLVFAFPGLILATVFVTFPFVARSILPLLEAQGREEEEAAISLGARWPSVMWHVTLPNVRWALLQGVLLCTARALGEFGAVAVVSGRIRGQTDTMPLQIEALYNDFHARAAFSLAAVLASLGLVTVAAKSFIENRNRSDGAGRLA